jgi:hypothetical protein
MIIKYPTGLYVDQLPSKPSDVGNVTYTISNNDPSKAQDNFIIYPIAEKLRKRSPRIYNQERRRVSLGDLVYTITKGGVSSVGRSTKLFEVGQFLDFDDVSTIAMFNTTSDRLELQHNTNLLDLSGLGLTDEEITQLTNDAASFKEELEIKITATQNEIANNQSEIADLQKTINEANKALSALDALGESGDIKQRITNTKDVSITNQSVIIEETDGLITEVTTLQNKLFNVSQLVR